MKNGCICFLVIDPILLLGPVCADATLVFEQQTIMTSLVVVGPDGIEESGTRWEVGHWAKLKNISINKTLHFEQLWCNKFLTMFCFEHLTLKEDVQIGFFACGKSKWIIKVKDTVECYIAVIHNWLHRVKIQILIGARHKWNCCLVSLELWYECI